MCSESFLLGCRETWGRRASDQWVEEPDLGFQMSGSVGEEDCVVFWDCGGVRCKSCGEETMPGRGVVWSLKTVVEGIAVGKVQVKDWQER